MNLSEGAAAFRLIADKAKSELAVTVVREQAKDFLAIERIVTPKRSGALAASEAIDSLSGGGDHAEATVSPHRVYAEIINDGGTVTRHAPRPHVLGHYGGPYFGHGNPAHVDIKGRHYVQKAEAASRGVLESAAEAAVAEFFDF